LPIFRATIYVIGPYIMIVYM